MTRSICKLEGCKKFVTGLGLCNAHYRMMRKHGDPLVKKGVTPGTVRAWLVEHKTYDGDDCLQFPFARNRKGYGVVGIDGFRLAHQWMCNEVNGPSSPQAPFSLHSCGNGGDGCVHPKHLYWGSGGQNYQDQLKHGVAARGDRHGKAILSEADIPVIRARRKNGESYKDIASTFGINKDTIRCVLNGRSWAWVQ